MSHPRHSCLRWLMLALLLFAQAANAALPCLDAGAGPLMAYGTPRLAHDGMQADMDMSADTGCPHDANPNACLNQCTQDAQSSDHAELPALAAPLAAVLTVARSESVLPAYVCDATVLRVAPDPPIPIRYCSFLN